MTKRIVMRTFSTDEHWNGGAENAYVLLDERLAKVIAGRLNLLDASTVSNPELVEMHFQSEDVECGFYNELGFHDDASGFLPGEEVEEEYNESGWAEIPDSSPFKGDLSRDSFDEVFGILAENTYMVINEYGVYWEMYPAHTSIRIQSEVLPRSVLSEVT